MPKKRLHQTVQATGERRRAMKPFDYGVMDVTHTTPPEKGMIVFQVSVPLAKLEGDCDGSSNANLSAGSDIDTEAGSVKDGSLASRIPQFNIGRQGLADSTGFRSVVCYQPTICLRRFLPPGGIAVREKWLALDDR
jgi:hypothetical protein